MREAKSQKVNRLCSFFNRVDHVGGTLVVGGEIVLRRKVACDLYQWIGNFAKGWRATEFTLFEHPFEFGGIVFRQPRVLEIHAVIVVAVGAVLCEVHRTGPDRFSVENHELVVHERARALVVHHGDIHGPQRCYATFPNIVCFRYQPHLHAALHGFSQCRDNDFIVEFKAANIDSCLCLVDVATQHASRVARYRTIVFRLGEIHPNRLRRLVVRARFSLEDGNLFLNFFSTPHQPLDLFTGEVACSTRSQCD